MSLIYTAFSIELFLSNLSDLTYFLSYATIFYATIFKYFDITAVICFAYKVKILVILTYPNSRLIGK